MPLSDILFIDKEGTKIEPEIVSAVFNSKYIDTKNFQE
jgi:hypothetical protein